MGKSKKLNLDRILNQTICNSCGCARCECPPKSIYINPSGIGGDGKPCPKTISESMAQVRSGDTIILRGSK